MNNSAEHYKPVRASDRTERARLFATVQELEKKFSDAQSRSEIAPDPSYGRLAYRLGKDLDAARERLSEFDSRVQELDRRRSSDEVKNARSDTYKKAVAFEKALLQAANAAADLRDFALSLNNLLGNRDSGVFPHARQVDHAIRHYTIEVLGSVAGLKFEGFGTKPAVSISERFSTEKKI